MEHDIHSSNQLLSKCNGPQRISFVLKAAAPCLDGAALISQRYTPTDHAAGKPRPFDHARVHTLYKELFGKLA